MGGGGGAWLMLIKRKSCPLSNVDEWWVAWQSIAKYRVKILFATFCTLLGALIYVTVENF